MDEVARRYGRVREALARDGLDAVLVCGSEYTGFEGAVTYMSGFQIVHRYAYVVLPAEGDPAIVFPAEARYVGEHSTTRNSDACSAAKPASVGVRPRTSQLRKIGRRDFGTGPTIVGRPTRFLSMRLWRARARSSRGTSASTSRGR